MNTNVLNFKFYLLTTKTLLPQLKESLSQAENCIFIVGPWLDAYFTRIIVDSITNKNVEVKFIVRIDQGVIDQKTLSALNLAQQSFKNFQAKSLENLHSKVVLIDKEIFLLGSANWYWYSLHESLETVIKGPTDQIPELIGELEEYWAKGHIIPLNEIIKYQDFDPVRTEKKS